jgi:hypothetical protein
MHFILDRIALAVTLMVVTPAAPAIALVWGGWLVLQWMCNSTTEPASPVHHRPDPKPQGGSRLTPASEFSLAA